MRLGLIGGTGLVSLASDGIEFSRIDDIVAETEFGPVPMTCASLQNGSELIFIQRHHGEGTNPPHMINHHANISALAAAGCDSILAVCSVGTIPANFPPGSVGYATQYIDMTGVAATFHDMDAQFTSMTSPFDLEMNQKISQVLSKLQQGLILERTYWLTQGPQFESKAEIDAIEKLGGEVVGMTMPRECKLAAEIEMPYSAILIASNWAAGRHPDDSSAPLDHEEVSLQANDRLQPVLECIKALAQ